MKLLTSLKLLPPYAKACIYIWLTSTSVLVVLGTLEAVDSIWIMIGGTITLVIILLIAANNSNRSRGSGFGKRIVLTP